jgi:hypothetical protein
LEAKINELATKNKNKNNGDLYRGTNLFKKDYKLRTKLVEKSRVVFFQIPTTFGMRGKNYFSQLLNVHKLVMLGRGIYILLSH